MEGHTHALSVEFVRAVLLQLTMAQRRRVIELPNIVLQPQYSRRISNLFDDMVAESLMNRKLYLHKLHERVQPDSGETRLKVAG